MNGPMDGRLPAYYLVPPWSPEWTLRAACVGEDPELFFPRAGRSATANKAKEICARCPVRQECLDTAAANREAHGVWGGLSPDQRKVEVTLCRKCGEPTERYRMWCPEHSNAVRKRSVRVSDERRRDRGRGAA